jgi:hypothetical protein
VKLAAVLHRLDERAPHGREFGSNGAALLRRREIHQTLWPFPRSKAQRPRAQAIQESEHASSSTIVTVTMVFNQRHGPGSEPRSFPSCLASLLVCWFAGCWLRLIWKQLRPCPFGAQGTGTNTSSFGLTRKTLVGGDPTTVDSMFKWLLSPQLGESGIRKQWDVFLLAYKAALIFVFVFVSSF